MVDVNKIPGIHFKNQKTEQLWTIIGLENNQKQSFELKDLNEQRKENWLELECKMHNK